MKSCLPHPLFPHLHNPYPTSNLSASKFCVELGARVSFNFGKKSTSSKKSQKKKKKEGWKETALLNGGEAELKLGLLSPASPGNQPSHCDPLSSDKSLTEQQCDQSKRAAQQNFTCWSSERELKQTPMGSFSFSVSGVWERVSSRLQMRKSLDQASYLNPTLGSWLRALRLLFPPEHLAQHPVSHTASRGVKK